VVLDGQDLTDRLAPRLLDLSLTESRGDEADELNLRLHDHDGRVALPRRGVTLQVAIGWRESGLFDKGTFVVDDVEHSGARYRRHPGALGGSDRSCPQPPRAQLA
jgi:phage protein D